MTKGLLYSAFILSCLPAPPASGQTAAQSFPPTRVRLLDGPFRQAQELHRTGLVGKLDPDRLLFQFRQNAGLAQPARATSSYGGWDSGFLAGHLAGHYLSAASRMYAATGDGTFRAKVDSMVAVLAECQQKLGAGYLSAFPLSRFDKLEASPKDGGVEYYTIHKILNGLLDAALYCDNPRAITVAAALSDFFAARVARLPPDRIEALLRTDYTANPHNEFGGMPEALIDLYAQSQALGLPDAERHLRFSSVFRRPWFSQPLLSGTGKLDGLHANTHIPQAAGLARYARISADESAWKAAANFWRMVTEQHSFANGSHGFNEKFRGAGVEVAGSGESALSPLTGETCGTYNMLRLTRLLFEHTPSAAYGDYYENALYNHILTTIAPDDGKVVYFTPLRPGDYRTYIDQPYCCLGTGIENTARFNEAVYFHQGKSLWVNLYLPSTLDWREQSMKLRLETRYPESGTIRILIDVPRPVTAELHLRIPGWLRGKPQLKVNGKPLQMQAAPGSFVAINRTWNPADVLELHLPLSLRVRPSMDDPSVVSFFHGPILLAGKLGREGMPATDTGENGANAKTPPWPVPPLAATPSNLTAALRPQPGKPLAYTVRTVNSRAGSPAQLDLVPLYQIHHQRYAVYWKVPPPRN